MWQETLVFFEKDHLNLERKPIQCFTEIATKIISDLELGNLFFLYSYSYYLLSLFDLSNLFHLSNLFDSCTLFFLLCTRLCFEDRPTNRPTDQPTDRQTYRPSPRCFVATPKHKNYEILDTCQNCIVTYHGQK